MNWNEIKERRYKVRNDETQPAISHQSKEYEAILLERTIIRPIRMNFKEILIFSSSSLFLALLLVAVAFFVVVVSLEWKS